MEANVMTLDKTTYDNLMIQSQKNWDEFIQPYELRNKKLEEELEEAKKKVADLEGKNTRIKEGLADGKVPVKITYRGHTHSDQTQIIFYTEEELSTQIKKGLSAITRCQESINEIKSEFSPY